MKIEPIFFDTYISVIKNSVGTKIFRNVYANVDGKKKNITEKGNLSCAFFVSSILTIFKLIKEIHTTVGGTEKDLINSGWNKIEKPKIGSIIIWSASKQSKGHRHIGFCISKTKAISNDSKSKFPKIHSINIKGREIEKIFHHQKI